MTRSSFTPHPSSIRNADRSLRAFVPPCLRAFTLIELIVVITIIVVLMGLGTIAFNSLTGRRSTSMAKNQISAMLNKARALAINDTSGLPVAYGVFFFLDPETDRTAMALFRRNAKGDGDPDPHDNYKGWTLGATGAGVAYALGDRVVAVCRDDNEGGIPMVRLFRCILPHTSSQATRPPAVVTTIPASNGYWEEVIPGDITVLDQPVELLPVGVGVQTMTDASVTPTDRYLRFGAVLFDTQGRLEHISYQIGQDSPLGLRLHLTSTLGTSNLYSQMGLAVYDLEAFRQAGHTESDRHPNVVVPSLLPQPSATAESTEEQWIDENSSLLLINRASGELTTVR